MPKSFSESERNYIRNRLKEEARICLGQYGMKKTTVDELVKRVCIPKGTFYLFYESKELLFYDVLCEFHDEMHAKLIKEVSDISDDISTDKLTDLIMGLYEMVENSFMLRFLADGEIEMLIRKLPPEIAADHAIEDNFSVEQLFMAAPQLKGKNIEAFSAALRGIFLTILYKHEIGEEIYKEALKILVRGVVLQLFEGEEK